MQITRKFFTHKCLFCTYHRPLKIRTDGSHARVCELGSIGVLGFFSVILSKVVCLLQNLISMMPTLLIWLLYDFYFWFNLTKKICSVFLYVSMHVTCTHLRMHNNPQVGSKWWTSRTDIVSSNSEMTDVNSGSWIATVSRSWSPCAMLSVRVGILEKDVSWPSSLPTPLW